MQSSLLYAHIGDLHLTGSKEQNYKDLLSIIADIETCCADKIDMVYLPGDNADHAEVHSYHLLRTAKKMLSVPVYAISGDHDMEQGNLDNFHLMLVTEQIPYAVDIHHTKCLFLDICGNGNGGPDFRLGEKQLVWLRNEIDTAVYRQQPIALFMHSFPDDLKEEEEKNTLNNLIAENSIVLVDMGHTHYNEISNDGHTIYTATRSTGQIEEGPVGYSVVSVHENVVSWRFKLLDEPFPFVMITYPGDHHLATDQWQDGVMEEVNAVVMADKGITKVLCAVNNSEWMPMSYCERKKCWILSGINITSGDRITVKATDETGRPGIHTIQYAASEKRETGNLKPGSDDFRIDAWPENHVFGTQLGPNRNAKPAQPKHHK